MVYAKAIEILQRAQRRSKVSGRPIDADRVAEELHDILLSSGIIESEDELVEAFLALDRNSPVWHRRSPPAHQFTGYSAGGRYGHREPVTNFQLLRIFRAVARVKRPIRSKRLKGLARIHVNRALRAYERHWLQRKGIDLNNPIPDLLNRRLRPQEHSRIRAVITTRIIPYFERLPSNSNAAKPWKVSVILQLSDLFAYYAPPQGGQELGSAALPHAESSQFIGFLVSVLAPYLAVNEVTFGGLSNLWRTQKRIMQTDLREAPSNKTPPPERI